MEIISALSGVTPLYTPWLEEPELEGAEEQRVIRSMAKLEKFLAKQNTLSLFPHFQLDPSKQFVPKIARDSSIPTWQPGQSAW